MKTINLRDYYPHYKEDEFYEVPDAIADLLREFERKEKNYIRAPLKIYGCPQAPIFHSIFQPKLLVIRQYDCVVLTIIYYKISAPLNNRIFLEVPIRKIKRYRAYFSLDVGDKIEIETLLSQNDPADILELRMLFEIAYQSLDMLTRKQGLRVYKYLFQV